MLQRSRTSCSRASGVVRRLVRNRWVGWNGLPSRVPLTVTSTIQLVPIQTSLMCSGSCAFPRCFCGDVEGDLNLANRFADLDDLGGAGDGMGFDLAP